MRETNCKSIANISLNLGIAPEEMYKDVKRRDETEETRIGEIEENGRKISNGNTESAFGEE